MSLQFLCAAAFARFMRQRVLGSQELASSALTYGIFETSPTSTIAKSKLGGTRFRAR
jgi:hypothetical protein